MFASVETELRKHLQEHNSKPNEVNVEGVTTKIIENDDVLFYWSMVSASWTRRWHLNLLITEYLKSGVTPLPQHGSNDTRETPNCLSRSQKVFENKYCVILLHSTAKRPHP